MLVFERQSIWRKLFGLSPKEMRFVGSGTVWRVYPGFRRCGAGMESFLADTWSRIQWESKHGS